MSADWECAHVGRALLPVFYSSRHTPCAVTGRMSSFCGRHTECACYFVGRSKSARPPLGHDDPGGARPGHVAVSGHDVARQERCDPLLEDSPIVPVSAG